MSTTGTNFFRARHLCEWAQIQAHRRALKKLRCGGRLARQLIEDRTRVGGMKPHLDEAHLAKANLNGMLACGIGWFVHQETGRF